MDLPGDRTFLTGPAKWALYLRISLHVAWRYGIRTLRGELGCSPYLRFLRRALLLLGALRHGKVVRRDGLYKVHVYVPAYPSEAFFHLLDKLLSPEPGAGTVVFSMGKACRYRCPHCYQRQDQGKDLEVDRMVEVAREMRDLGVSLFDVEGGEPLLQMGRVRALLAGLDERSEQWLNTTGDGLTPDMVRELKACGLKGVFVSLHSPDAAAHEAFTGIAGSFAAACEALAHFGRAGIFTAVNTCLEAEAVERGDLERLLAVAKGLGCDFVQVIHPKPSGAWIGRAGERRDEAAAVATARMIHLRYNSGGRYRDYPAVSAQVFEEEGSRFGCTAGGVDRFYLGADGEVQPCEFLNVSFGNVKEEDFGTIFRRMRSYFQVPGSDWLCCTQAPSILRALSDHGLKRTPVPREITTGLVGSWYRGKPTPLYRRLGNYRDRGSGTGDRGPGTGDRGPGIGDQ